MKILFSLLISSTLFGCATTDRTPANQPPAPTPVTTPQPTPMAYDCTQVNATWQANVGSISPNNADMFIKKPDFAIEPNLKILSEDIPALVEALRLGLEIKRFGNEPMIYNVDALLNMVQETSPNPLINMWPRIRKIRSQPPHQNRTYYSVGFQTLRGLRTVAALHLMSRGAEADQLNELLNHVLEQVENRKVVIDGQSRLTEVNSLIANTGRFKNASHAMKFCQLLMNPQNQK